MKFHELPMHEKFTIEVEPNSRFHKVGDRYDGACNAYREIENNIDIPIESVSIPKNMEIRRVKDC